MPPKKATSQQYKALVNLVKDCDFVRYGKGTPDQKKEAWEKISSILNAIGGIEKTAEGWKKAYTEMKSHIKAKIRDGKTLNDIEKTCADISGLFISCAGLPNVPELGGNIETIIVENEVSERPEITEGILVQEGHPEIEMVFEKEQDETQAEGSAQEKAQTTTKKIGSKKKPDKSMQSLLNEHIISTNRGLQEIAISIQAVAEAINNVALAIRESKEQRGD